MTYPNEVHGDLRMCLGGFRTGSRCSADSDVQVLSGAVGAGRRDGVGRPPESGRRGAAVIQLGKVDEAGAGFYGRFSCPALVGGRPDLWWPSSTG